MLRLCQRTNRLLRFIALTLLLAVGLPAVAQVSLISIDPPYGESDVPLTAPIVFTFSEAMDPELTTATVIKLSPFTVWSMNFTWNTGNTVLTCTPLQPYEPMTFMFWSVSGESAGGEPLEEAGSFNTASGAPGTGTGTNRITTFTLGVTHAYTQTSTVAPVVATQDPYSFGATTTLASNRTATNISLSIPTVPAALSNLFRNPLQAEVFFLAASYTSQVSLDAAFPAGAYAFTVEATTSNQSVTVTLPATTAQPPAPYLTNYPAAQAVDPAQPFRLGWAPWTGGTTADFIGVEIDPVFRSPDYGQPGALNGTATSVEIPAGTLQPNETYEVTLGFYRATWNTNDPGYATSAYRATTTRFTLVTSGGTQPAVPVLTNSAWTNGAMEFDVGAPSGQPIVVEFSTSLLTNSWNILLTTNGNGSLLRVRDPQFTIDLKRFYRLRSN